MVKEGDVLTLRVVKIDPEQRRMGLSLKRVSSAEYLEDDFKRATSPIEEPPTLVDDMAGYEAATLKSEDRRRVDRKKGKKGKKGKEGFDEFDEFEDDDDEY